MSTEIYKRHRPKTLAGIVGQADAISELETHLGKKSLPHVILLSGPSGSGKTTIARILTGAVHCTVGNLIELNCADVRGIDTVRDINESLRYSPMGGRAKVWILDECVQLPSATQQAFLKVLEDPPKFAWFFLCASDTSGLLKTFLSRCTIIRLKALEHDTLRDLIMRIAAEELPVTTKVAEAIASKADGNARSALQMLESIMTLTSEKQQLARIAAEGSKDKVEFLARLVLQRANWSAICKAIEDIKDNDLEGTRRAVLGYASAVIRNNSKDKDMAYLMIQAFRDPWHSCGKAGLDAACWEVCTHK